MFICFILNTAHIETGHYAFDSLTFPFKQFRTLLSSIVQTPINKFIVREFGVFHIREMNISSELEFLEYHLFFVRSKLSDLDKYSQESPCLIVERPSYFGTHDKYI